MSGEKNRPCEGCGGMAERDGGYVISSVGAKGGGKSYLCGDCAFEFIVSERRTEELGALAERVLAEKARREQKINSSIRDIQYV